MGVAFFPFGLLAATLRVFSVVSALADPFRFRTGIAIAFSVAASIYLDLDRFMIRLDFDRECIYVPRGSVLLRPTWYDAGIRCHGHASSDAHGGRGCSGVHRP